MAVNNRRLKVTELDFDNIKSNLKTFLKNQNQLIRFITKQLDILNVEIFLWMR